MEKLFLLGAMVCGLGMMTACKSGRENDAFTDSAMSSEDYPYEIVMTAIELDLQTFIAITPKDFETSEDCDTVVITQDTIIHRIVDELIDSAEVYDFNRLDTRGKLVLKYRTKEDVVLYYNALTMLLNGHYYLVDPKATEFLDEIREKNFPSTIDNPQDEIFNKTADSIKMKVREKKREELRNKKKSNQ